MAAIQPLPRSAVPDRPPLRKRAKRALRYLGIRIVLSMIAWLRLRGVVPLGDALGHLAAALFRGERAKATRSLGVAFPSISVAEAEALTRRMFEHLATCALELALIPQVDQQMQTYVELSAEDQALMDRALQEGRGVVFVSGHVGNWELLARRFSWGGYDCATIAKESSDPRLTRLIERVRASGRLRSIWRGVPGAAKQMLRQLKNNGVLGLLIDQDTRVQGVFVDFFGRRAFTPRAAADLAVRAEAAVIAGFIHRRPEGGHRVRLERIPLPSSAGEEAVLELTQALTRAIEEAIRRNPAEWVWMHQRWKTRPPDEAAGAPAASSALVASTAG